MKKTPIFMHTLCIWELYQSHSTFFRNVFIMLILIFFLDACSNQQQSTARNEAEGTRELVEENPLLTMKLEGTWESKDNSLYPKLSFKGKSTIVITTLFDMEVASSYERDETFLRVKTDQSDLLFEITATDTIIGCGFAKGTWIKR